MVHINRAIDNGAQLMENSVVHRVEVDTDGVVTGVTWRDPDGQDHTITAQYYVMAANGIETPKILLMSTGEHSPNGVANSSDQVGRNLADHPEIGTSAMLTQAYAGHRGPLQLSGIDATREGDFRSERSAIRFQVAHSVGNPADVAQELIAQGVHGAELQQRILEIAPYRVRVASMTEQLPNPENRVLPHESETDEIGIPRPHLIYSYDDYTMAGLEEARRFQREILEVMGASDIVDDEEPYGVGHLLGTYRMGDDPADSVTDADGRTHDHPNLFLAGSGLFPTTGTANPTLTISALALRTAQVLRADLEVGSSQATPVVSSMATPAAD